MLVLGHLLKSLFRAFFKITFFALFTGALAAGATLLVAYLNNGQIWPPRRLIEVAAVVIGVLAAYAAGLTMLLREAVQAALSVEHEAVTGVEHEVATLEREARGVRQ
ncbi:MAG TPA: hypothetical protein VGR57_09215 [Ktedonobacterales bacterium]|nr:hypothetical protein [Ktedonobacterales bacterium]